MKFKSKSKRRKTRTDLSQDISVVLPEDYPWKVLGWLASDLSEYLDESEIRRISDIVRNRDIEGYLQLSQDWGLQCISPDDTAHISVVRAKYLLAGLLKKYRFNTEKEARILAATEKFRSFEDDCAKYNLEGYKRFSWGEEDWAINVFTYARSFIRKLLGDTLPGAEVMTEWSRHGPGASIGLPYGSTCSYYKYSVWPYSCTISALRYARFLIETDQRWFGALQDSYRSRKKMNMWEPLDMEQFWADVIDIVPGNKITFVPKNAKIERSIAIEPTLNLYLQLGVDGIIRRRLKRWGVDLDHQEKNQELARRGSVGADGDDFVTIDLAGASDSVSLKLCELLLPTEWNNYLLDLRSPEGELEGEVLRYNKISSMGNGFTFALESLIFTAIIYGVMKETLGSVDTNTFAVFGDDLIVPKAVSVRLIEALALAGFTVNSEKSFLQGPIRESCGTDWFNGKPIRPVFFVDIPSDVMDLFVDINRLDRLLQLRWGIEESKSISLLEKWIPDTCKKYRGPLSDEDFDSYRHDKSHTCGLYESCLWKYPRLVVIPRPQKGNQFFFRKLMVPLRVGPKPYLPLWIKPWWMRRFAGGSGSSFTVTSCKALTVGESYSVADIWRSSYAEYYPSWNRPSSASE